MERTPSGVRELLEHAGYAWNPDAEAWLRRGHKPDPLRERMLDAAIARSLTPEQVQEWIKAGEGRVD